MGIVGQVKCNESDHHHQKEFCNFKFLMMKISGIVKEKLLPGNEPC